MLATRAQRMLATHAQKTLAIRAQRMLATHAQKMLAIRVIPATAEENTLI
jgi:hypothetical protein